MPPALEFSANLLLALTTLPVAVSSAQTTPAELPADCSAYASIPLPPEADKVPAPKTPPSCASYRSYRGIGRPVNYAEARACAWRERLAHQANLGQNSKEPNAWVVGGPLILADIYANGAGLPRNLPLAMRFACEFDESAANGALPVLKNFGTTGPPRKSFELCDYAWTTFTANFCTVYRSEIEDGRRSRYYNSLRSSMSAEQKAAFDQLLAAENAYVDAHAAEVYQGGTIRTIRTLTSQEILNDLFRAEVAHYERKDWPHLTQNHIKRADSLVQSEYNRRLGQCRQLSKDDVEDGAVTPHGLTEAQQAWQRYRDAWATFAPLRYPAAARAVIAQITLDRYELLKTIH